MDWIIIFFGALLMISGILGSFLPVLPGIPLSWLGLLLLHLTTAIPVNWTFLSVTFAVTVIIFVLQYFIPALGTKYLGGSKKGMIGATIGLVAGIFIPIPFSILIVPFIGAFIGEILNKMDSRRALKAASGSFLGLIASSFMELFVTFVFFLLFLYKLWEYRSHLWAV